MSSHATALRLGLTGGIGSGKSTVAARLQEHGAAVMDADAISRSTTAPGGAALPAIAEAFGAHLLGRNGALDRTAMRTLVYQDAGARERLEAIIHPLVEVELQRQAERAVAAGARVLVFDIPLLVEAGTRWQERLDRILVIDCDRETQIARVLARDALSREQVESILSVQATREQRLAAADYVIFNGANVTLSNLNQKIDVFWSELAL